MNYDNLMSHFVGIRQTGTGQYKVTILYRGKEYSGTTNNTLAIDRMREDDYFLGKRHPGRIYTTAKQAAQSLYNEVKRQNGLS